jgi:hypothetical protein
MGRMKGGGKDDEELVATDGEATEKDDDDDVKVQGEKKAKKARNTKDDTGSVKQQPGKGKKEAKGKGKDVRDEEGSNDDEGDKATDDGEDEVPEKDDDDVKVEGKKNLKKAKNTEDDTGSAKPKSGKGKKEEKGKGKGKDVKDKGGSSDDEDEESTDEGETKKKEYVKVKVEGNEKGKNAKEVNKPKGGKIRKRSSVNTSSDDSTDPELKPKPKKSRETLEAGKLSLFIYYDLCELLLMLISVRIPVRRSQRSLAASRASSTQSVAAFGLSMPSVCNDGSSSGDWDPKVPTPGHFPLKSKSSSNPSLHTGSRASSSIPGDSNLAASEAGDGTAW